MKTERGVALIVALLLLSFLTILGGALLSNTTIETWISDNYKTATQNLYLTEAGIDQALEVIRTGSTPTQLLTTAAGSNGVLSTSTDLSALLASDDRPIIPSDASQRSAGQALADTSGRAIGRFHVWVRNDNADGITAATDTNQVLTLLSFGRIGTARKSIEVTVKKSGFPMIPAALTLDGPIDSFDAVNAAFPIELANDDAQLEPRLKSVSGLETLVTRISAHATDVFDPPLGTQTLGNFGSPLDYRIAVVNGDLHLGPGIGYGLLVARGNVTLSGTVAWNGLILIIGQGVLHWNGSAYGSIEGGVFLARTRAPDGTVLSTRGGVTADLKGAAGGGIRYNPAAITLANQGFPYTPIAIKER